MSIEEKMTEIIETLDKSELTTLLEKSIFHVGHKYVSNLIGGGASITDKLFINVCQSGYSEIVKVLLDAGISYEHSNQKALTEAFKNCRLNVCRILLENGWEITEDCIKGAMGETFYEGIDLLMEYGADINIIIKHMFKNTRIGFNEELSMKLLKAVNKYNPNYQEVIDGLDNDDSSDDNEDDYDY